MGTITSKLQLPRTNCASSTLRSIPIAASRAPTTQTQRRTFASGKDASYSTMSSKQDNSLFTRDNLFDLKGKVALVTGGGSGIGLMITQALAANGAKVYITGRTQEKLDTVVNTYNKNISGEIIALQGDISTKAGVKALYDEYQRREKCLCILVNNAGISSSSGQTESQSGGHMRHNLFEQGKFEDWQSTYNTNVTSAYFTSATFLPLLEQSTKTHPGWSSTIIMITSISGLIKTAQHHFAYNASKGAAVHLTRMLAGEGASNNLKIRVDGSDDTQKSYIPAEKYAEKVPARRPGKDEDMAQTALFFAACQYLNGQTVAVDGGYTLAAGE